MSRSEPDASVKGQYHAPPACRGWRSQRGMRGTREERPGRSGHAAGPVLGRCGYGFHRPTSAMPALSSRGVLGRAPRSPSFQPAAACLAPGASGSYAAFSRRLEHRERRGLMRSILLRAGLTVSLVTFAACGGSEQPTAPAATPTTAAKPPLAAVTTTTLEEEYELDVIAEAAPDEGASTLKGQLDA